MGACARAAIARGRSQRFAPLCTLSAVSLARDCSRASGAHRSNLRRAAARVRQLAPPVRTAATGGIRRCALLCCQPRVHARASGARSSNLRRAVARVRELAPP
eukprot:5350776-Pleurochrysis_carterae.AAC.1